MEIMLNKIKGFFAKHITETLILIVFIVVGFYCLNFTNLLSNNIKELLGVKLELSKNNGDWGTFGDYIGGILNPIIAAFALYLIAETYKLQKIELEKTIAILKISTDAQENQIKLAALTSLINFNLTKINILESEKISLLQKNSPEPKDSNKKANKFTEILQNRSNIDYPAEMIKVRFTKITTEIEELEKENIYLKSKIESFL
jgi:TRAP-type C4-dicarboxylate transport system permease small subunit